MLRTCNRIESLLAAMVEIGRLTPEDPESARSLEVIKQVLAAAAAFQLGNISELGFRQVTVREDNNGWKLCFPELATPHIVSLNLGLEALSLDPFPAGTGFDPEDEDSKIGTLTLALITAPV